MESLLYLEQPLYDDSLDPQAVLARPPSGWSVDTNLPRTMAGPNFFNVNASPFEEFMSSFQPYEWSWAAHLESQVAQPAVELSPLPVLQPAWMLNSYHAIDNEQGMPPFDSTAYTPSPPCQSQLSYPAPPLGFSKSPSTVASSPPASSPYENQSQWNASLARQLSSSSASSSSQAPHNPTKRYACHICGRAFQRQTTLTQHQITHTGERPYGCPIAGCDKAFTTASNAKRHAKTHYRASHSHQHHGASAFRASF